MFAVVAVNTPVHAGGTAFSGTNAPRSDTAHRYPGPIFHYDLPPDRIS